MNDADIKLWHATVWTLERHGLGCLAVGAVGKVLEGLEAAVHHLIPLLRLQLHKVECSRFFWVQIFLPQENLVVLLEDSTRELLAGLEALLREPGFIGKIQQRVRVRLHGSKRGAARACLSSS